MKLYRSFDIDQDLLVHWHGTLKEAHEDAKTCQPRANARVELVNVETDKEGVISLLNETQSFDAERTWRLTPRGGLTDCPTGE